MCRSTEPASYRKTLTVRVVVALVGLVALLASTAGATPSTITSNFNGTAIAGGDYIWFNSVLKASGLGPAPVTLSFTNALITFTNGGTNYSIPVPNAAITFSPSATMATTSYDTITNTWKTTTPSTGLSGNTWVSGIGFQVPAAGLTGGTNPVKWYIDIYTSTPGVSVSWQWAAAVYTSFTSNANAIGVKPVDDNSHSAYLNSDHAGTPENFKAFVVGGARGGGGSNFTGSYSATARVVPVVPEPSSLLALGTGLLGLTGLIRKTRAARS